MSDSVRLTIESSVLEDWVQRGEVWITQDHEERLTREEWAWEFAAAIKAAAEAVGREGVAVMREDDGRFVASICGFGEDFYGPDPISALEALAAAAKPALPDPDDMSAEECEAELEERDDALFVKRTIEHTVATLCVGDKTVGEWDYLCGDEFALRAAVRALREHQAAQSRT